MADLMSVEAWLAQVKVASITAEAFDIFGLKKCAAPPFTSFSRITIPPRASATFSNDGMAVGAAHCSFLACASFEDPCLPPIVNELVNNLLAPILKLLLFKTKSYLQIKRDQEFLGQDNTKMQDVWCYRIFF